MSKKMNSTICIIILFGFIQGALAKEKYDQSKCSSEVKKLCPNKKDKKVYSKCIQDSISKFHNPECVYSLLNETKGNRELLMRCHDKFQKMCEDNSADCYQKQRKNFDQSCKEELDSVFSPKISKMIDTCMGDLLKKCPLDESKMSDESYKKTYEECIEKNSSGISKECLNSLDVEDNTKVIEKEKR